MNKSLRTIQERFFTDVVIGSQIGGSKEVSDSYLPRGKFAGEDLIKVYRNNYVISLTEALSATYSAVKRLVGDEFFAYIAKDFISKYPLSSGYLTDFGDEFADFISQQDACKDLPYLVCIARLERCYEKAFHAAEKDAYQLEKFNQLKDCKQGLYVDMHPSVQLLSSTFPVVDIWLMDDESPVPDLQNNPQKVLIYRRNYEVQIELIDDSEYAFLNALMRNRCIDEVYENVKQPVDLQAFLIKYINRQVLVDFNNK